MTQRWNKKEYCLGLVFNETKSKLLLVRKKTPKWMAGLLNGIGGNIELGELAKEAMIRECGEEIKLDIHDWNRVCGLDLPEAYINVFSTIANLDSAVVVALEEISEIVLVDPDELDCKDYMPNLNWLIPMARYINPEYEIKNDQKTKILN